jgi:hypothetical protein
MVEYLLRMLAVSHRHRGHARLARPGHDKIRHVMAQQVRGICLLGDHRDYKSYRVRSPWFYYGVGNV